MEKNCSACQKRLPVSEFTKNSASEDLLSSRCRSCAREDRIKKGLQKPEGWERKTKNMSEYQKAWHKKNPSYRTERSKTWLSRNPERRKVRDAVKYALRTGKLQKLPCGVCGELEVEGHHSDYSRPLDVIWLCKEHHREIHKS